MSAKRTVYFECPFCNKNHLTREDLVEHISDDHEAELPEEFTPLRYTFNYVNRKPIEYHGICTECKRETPWDEAAGRYKRQCGRKVCHESYIRNFEQNMVKAKGVSRISQTPEGQEKMLANRRISGKYKFANGEEKTYTGSYELHCLEFLDKVMKIDPNDIMAPGPVVYYDYNGSKHIYITDFYYQPYNLIIEVKDGGDHPNGREMADTRARQKAKEKYIINNTNFNYLRLSGDDLSQIMKIFADLKMKMVENSGERVIHVNEAMNALMNTPPVGLNNPDSTYIINYMRKNVFSGDDEEGYGISYSPKLDSIYTRDREGKLVEKDGKKFLENAKYNIYKTFVSEDDKIEINNNIGEFVEEGFLFETIFHKPFYTYSQICIEAGYAEDFYAHMNLLEEVSSNYFNDNKDKCVTYKRKGDLLFQKNISNGKSVIRSSIDENAFLEFDESDIQESNLYNSDGAILLQEISKKVDKIDG